MPLTVPANATGAAGSSTGLHHDYHDNLYILLRGKKRFRLYPPSLAGRMYVHGELCLVHPNGRIVHKSQVRGGRAGGRAREGGVGREGSISSQQRLQPLATTWRCFRAMLQCLVPSLRL